ncbi:MAG TPA: RNA methyltransferase, partial [Myxococcota bacterium]|nr:RNA methyltransferase [Myxococcota bacterium]
RDRRASGKTVLDGIHLLQAFTSAGGVPELLVVSDSGQKRDEIAAFLQGAGPEVIEVPDAMFEQASTVATPTGIMAVIAIPKTSAKLVGTCVVLDGVQDAGNVGSILRSAAAAGIQHAVLGVGSANAWSPRVLRAAMGAHFSMTVHDGVTIASALADFQGAILTTEAQASHTIYDTNLTGDVAWLIGNEGAGVSTEARALATGSVAIPIAEGTESLNAAAAAAICFFEQRRQRLK